MKKRYTEEWYKQFKATQAERSLRRKLRSKSKRKERNRSDLNLSKEERHERRKQKQFHDYLKNYAQVKAPENFSFIKNPVEVIDFINELQEHFDDRIKVFVVLKNVKVIDYDAIVVLLSIMVRFKALKIAFNGDFPQDAIAKKVLRDSGFFDTLYGKKISDSEEYQIGKPNTILTLANGKENAILTHAKKNVDSLLGAKVIEQASVTIWGEIRRCQGVQRAFLELMQNTNNHASGRQLDQKHWWLSVNHRRAEHKVSFSFVDFGIGVFKSLESKTSESKFFGWADKMRTVFDFRTNAELFALILKGELHQTVTGKPYRGKGLPGVYQVLLRNQISGLHIITNNVYVDASKGIYKMLPKSFNGTFLYWELNASNVSSDGID